MMHGMTLKCLDVFVLAKVLLLLYYEAGVNKPHESSTSLAYYGVGRLYM